MLVFAAFGFRLFLFSLSINFHFTYLLSWCGVFSPLCEVHVPSISFFVHLVHLFHRFVVSFYHIICCVIPNSTFSLLNYSFHFHRLAQSPPTPLLQGGRETNLLHSPSILPSPFRAHHHFLIPGFIPWPTEGRQNSTACFSFHSIPFPSVEFCSKSFPRL